MHGQERTFLKVFIEVDDNRSKSAEELKSDSPNGAPSYLNTPPKSSSKPKSGSFTNGHPLKGSKSDPSYPTSHSSQSSSSAQYTIVPITNTSSAADVCAAVARKRNLLYTDEEYALVMCDGDGDRQYETRLSPDDKPHQHQQSAAKHGHLGDFHFVFKRVDDDDENTDVEDTDDGDSDAEMFQAATTIKHGKYPAAWMEKRGKNVKSWRRRYFVLIGDELLYYKRRDIYEHKKDPIARIQLVSPPGIIKIVPPETIRKNNNITTFFCFDIHTPKRVYSLRCDNYNDMIYWVKQLSRRNEPNELIDGLDSLLSESEQLHSNDDEAIMDKFSTLESILNDNSAIDAYMKYLQGIHNEEFIHFWLDLAKYLGDYQNMSKDTQKRFAIELYEKYIKSGAKYQLSEIKSKHRSNLKKQIQSGLITRTMFDDIKNSVFDYLNRDSYKFFNSSEYFRFIVTYKQTDTQYHDKFSWPKEFEHKIEADNKEKHEKMLQSTQRLIYKIRTNYKNGGNGYNKLSKYNASSPVLRNRPQSPVMQTKSYKNSYKNLTNGKHGHHPKSWTNNSAFDGKNNQSEKPKKKWSNGKSIFEDAPGLK